MDRKLQMHELGRQDLDAVRVMPRVPVRLLLDDVRSRHNVGAMFRTADAFGLEGLLLCGFTPTPPHREIEKTALGATASVPWEHRPRTIDAVRELQAVGYQVWCVEQTVHAVPLDRWQPGPGPLALVMGNELSGVADEVVAACNAAVVIPQSGIKHSLNVAVCAGVVVYQAVRSFAGVNSEAPRQP
jgi:tRNA G18 (ribose-2'-O)-methylase SpoU